MAKDPAKAMIRDQEGQLQPFPMRDTKDFRLFAKFLAVHDGYNGKGAVIEQTDRVA